MKLSSLINLVTDAQDVLDLFDGITSANQLQGRLRRIDLAEAEDLLACLTGLQTSITKALDDTLEMNPDLDDDDETDDDDEKSLPDELDSLDKDLTDEVPASDEDQNLNPPTVAEE